MNSTLRKQSLPAQAGIIYLIDALTLYLSLFLAASIGLAAIYFYFRQLHKVPLARSFARLTLMALGVNFLQFLEITTPDLAGKLLFLNLRMALYTLVPPVLMLAALEYAEQPAAWLTAQRRWLWLEPVIISLAALTSPYHDLFRLNYALDPAAGLSGLAWQRGPLLYFHQVYAYGLGLYALVVMLGAVRHKKRHLSGALLLALGILIPGLAELGYSLNFPPGLPFNPGPVSNLLTALLYLAALRQIKQFEVAPLAYSLVVNNLADLTFILDAAGRLVDFNPAAARRLALSDQALGRPLAEALPPEWAALLAPYAGAAIQVETALTSGETVQEFELHSLLVLDAAGQTRGQALVLRDISSRKRAQTELLAQKIKLAVAEERQQMGRDLHDSLGQVIGFVALQAESAQNLLAQDQPRPAAETLAQLQQAAQAANRDLRKYLLRLRQDEPPPDFVQALADYLREFQQASGIEVQFKPSQCEANLEAQAERQALLVVQEALANVRKHAGAGRVEVALLQSEAETLLLVSDDGAGFTPGSAPGLEAGHFGLKIMRERAEAAGGRLEIFSAPGQGTRLLLRLAHPSTPNAPIPPQTAASASAAAPRSRPLTQLHGLRLLLADDHPLFLQGLSSLLAGRGAEILGLAHDGLEALALARALRPDIALLDLNMPGLNGLEVARALAQEMPDLRTALLTVSEEPEHLVQALQAGACGYLLKSQEAESLCQAVARLGRGERLLAPGLAERALLQLGGSPPPPLPAPEAAAAPARPLSARQVEILKLASQGLTYKEIGQHLRLSEKTVKYHIAQIQARLQVENRLQAIAKFQQMYRP